MAEHSSERAERRLWTPEVIDEQTAGFRPRGPGRDAAATLAVELLEIAENALHDPSAAERIVTGVMQSEAQLVALATRAGSTSDREVAQAALARIVRRAVLDALPPVVASPRAGPGSGPGSGKTGQEAAAAAPAARKFRPAGAAAPAVARVGAPATGGRRGLGRATGLALLVLLLAGFGLWHFVLGPAPAVTPSPLPTAAAENGLAPGANAADTTAAPLVTLQLEAAEPSGGPLRATAQPGGGAAATAPDGRPPPRPIRMAQPASVDAAGGALAASGGDLRVFVLYPAGEAAAGEARAVYAALSRAGELPLVVLRDVDFAIASPRIRYFHTTDAAAARAIAERLAPLDPGWTLQDFGHIRPLPAAGTVEIYVPAP